MRKVIKLVFVVAGLLGAAPIAAQELGTTASTVVTIDREKLFLNSDFGKRVAREVEAAGNELAAENRRIEADLADAEQELTDLRATMSVTDFRPLADAFDTRVQTTRQAQAAKTRALNALLGQERDVFLNAAAPVIETLMKEIGVSVVLDRRTVFSSAASSDITEDAIQRLNDDLGEGTNIKLPPALQASPPQD
ncbi:Skp family chaperone for outer membrane proteins [Sulfitobacter undariae]|uniref:Skp family chaperone for outer membrane proteins n=1 Tax=Sulfitobacter undariae TaxID=1563671 RepID=A0A7W6H1B4_9RHOB|nr:OmpH family outer membrane protein [Sulfitobacter undariae]MBB3994563.1 Skp family chaperone for outer membrane proteins [Sulfitobacter undariae]